IDVDHVIVRLEIAKVGKESCRFRFALFPLGSVYSFCGGRTSIDRVGGFVKEFRLDVNDQSRLRQLEAPPEMAHRHDDWSPTRWVRSFGGERQASLDLVLVEYLDDSLSHAETRHDEERRPYFFNVATHFSREIRDATVITKRRLRLQLDFER